MVECTALERRHTVTGIQGSNPCLSAVNKVKKGKKDAHRLASARDERVGAICEFESNFRDARRATGSRIPVSPQ